MTRQPANRRLRFARPKKADQEDGWMVSYGDMMTLLLVFFVLLVAISQIDAVRLQMVTQSMRNAMGVQSEHVPTLREIELRLDGILERLRLQERVAVTRDRQGVRLMIRGETLFASGEAHLLLSVHRVLESIGREIARTPYKVRIEGHTDSIPITTGKFPSNWELSCARAAAVARFFEERGLERRRFSVAGYAETRPVDPVLGNSTADARARNRRVVVTFLNEYLEDWTPPVVVPSLEVTEL